MSAVGISIAGFAGTLKGLGIGMFVNYKTTTSEIDFLLAFSKSLFLILLKPR